MVEERKVHVGRGWREWETLRVDDDTGEWLRVTLIDRS